MHTVTLISMEWINKITPFSLPLQPKLDRQEIKEHDEGKSEEVLEGEGTEYRQKEREDARKRRRGFRSRKPNPADQPWILREHKKGGKQLVGGAYAFP